MRHSKKSDIHLLGQMPAELAERLLMEWVNIGDGAGYDKVPERIKAATRLMLYFPETFRLSRERRTELLRLDAVEEPTHEQLDELRSLDDRLLLVEQLRELLRRVWRSTSPRDREWLILIIRATHHCFMHHPSSKLRLAGTETKVRFEKDPATGQFKAYLAEEPPTVPFDILTARRDGRLVWLRNYLRRTSDLPEVDFTFDLSADVCAPEMNIFERVMYYFQRNEDRARRCAYPECGAPYFFAKKKGQRYCSSDCSADAKREQNRQWWRKNRGKENF